MNATVVIPAHAGIQCRSRTLQRFVRYAGWICLAALACCLPAQAQDTFPSRPIRLLVPQGAGSTTDIVARTIAERASRKLGQPIVVENKQGAGGVIAAQATLSAPADGYTLLLANSQHVINPFVYKPLPYDTMRDFAGVALVAEAPAVVVVSSKLGVRNLKDFIAAAKKKPGSIHYASGGIGSQTHLAGAYFASEAHIDMVHVPYNGSAAVIPDLLSGRVQATFAPAGFVLPSLADGRLVALAVTTKAPMRAPLDAPSVNEAAIPGFEYATWFGFVAPAKVPAAVIERLASALEAAANEPEVKAKLLEQGVVTRTLAGREFDGYIKADMDRLGPIVKSAGIAQDR